MQKDQSPQSTPHDFQNYRQRKRRNQFNNQPYFLKGDTSIVSYGLIIYRVRYDNSINQSSQTSQTSQTSQNPTIEFLLQQRRDTFEYMDILLGTWKTVEELVTLISLITPEEKERLRNYIFSELWNDLFLNKNS